MSDLFMGKPTNSRRMGRGRSQQTLSIIAAAHVFLEANAPATVRSCCYNLFTKGLIPNMGKSSTNGVGRILREARERAEIPWQWIVDETREAETISAWTDLAQYGEAVLRSYRRDRWRDQPVYIECWTEKGTQRAVLAPILDEFCVALRVMHGFSSATTVNEVAKLSAELDKPFGAFYLGDFDPSGCYMSDADLPTRIARYGGDIQLERLALVQDDLPALPSFSAHEKSGDTRYSWFTERYGDRCWEIDAMEPRLLRERLRAAILSQIDTDSWNRAARIEAVERNNLREFKWAAGGDQ